MGITFNADEIFEIAEQIERNGAKFYRQAAGHVSEGGSRDLLLRLAEWEDGHETFFHTLREDLSKAEATPTVYDPEGEAAAYLQAYADGHVFDLKTAPADLLTGTETLAEILQTAIGLERDSIAFYLGIRDWVPANLGKDRVEEIIREEMSHVVYLNGELAQA